MKIKTAEVINPPAMSMAAGEYVSVKSQEDTESADLKMESDSLAMVFTALVGKLFGVSV